MTANASDYRDSTSRDDLARLVDSLFGYIVEHTVNEHEAARYGRSAKSLRANERALLEDAVSANVWGRATASGDDVDRWIDIARRQNRGGAS